MRRLFSEIEKTIHVVIERRNAMDGKGAKPVMCIFGRIRWITTEYKKCFQNVCGLIA